MKTNTVAASREANANFSEKEKHRNIILKTLSKYGNLDNRQISNRCNLGYIQVARRMSELRDSGKIYEHSKHKPAGYTTSLTVWSLIQ